MNQENGKGIIFGVLGILTLIIAIMGASLAYFTATAMDTDPEKIIVQAATVTISYEQGTILEAKDLIPASFDVAEWAYNRGVEKDQETQIEEDMQCKDDKGYTVCSVFRFNVSNEAGKNDSAIVGTIKTTTDASKNKDSREFDNLMYTIYEVEYDTSNVVTSRTEINKDKHITFGKVADDATQLFSHALEPGSDLKENEVKVPAGTKKYYELVIWLNEKSNDVTTDEGTGNQDYEQGLSYEGTISVTVSGASDKITGTIGQ